MALPFCLPSHALGCGQALLLQPSPCLPSHALGCCSQKGSKRARHGMAALSPAQVPSTFPEDLDKSLYTPESYVVENAKQKALEVHSRLTGEGEEPP